MQRAHIYILHLAFAAKVRPSVKKYEIFIPSLSLNESHVIIIEN